MHEKEKAIPGMITIHLNMLEPTKRGGDWMKLQGKTKSMGAGLLLGTLLSIAMLLSELGVLAELIEKEIITYSSMGYGILFSIVAAAFAGSALSVGLIRRRVLLAVSAHALLLWGTLLCITALFFGGQYCAVDVTGLLVMCGSVLPVFLFRTDGPSRKFKRKSPKL